MKQVRFWVFSLFAILSLLLVACGQQPASAPAAPAAPASGGSSGESSASSGGVTLDIGIKGEELAFDKDTMETTAAEGEEVTVNFENTSATQEHNWILLKTSDMDEASAFNDVAMPNVDNSYYPEDGDEMLDMVIAYVETLQPGEAESVTFESPGPGEYIYLCTVAGHFAAGDHGVLTIN